MKPAHIALSILLLLAAALPASGSPKTTTLYGYLIGSAPAGMTEVMAELNRRLKTDLGCVMEITYINWADRQSKYPLILAAGENIDWIYTAQWCQYAQQAARGAFLELTPEMLASFMPRHFSAVPERGWRETLINGRIFMVPSATPDRKVPIFLLRGDLRRRYGIPEITNMNQAEPYLAAVKKNQPGMIPLNVETGYDLVFVFSAVANSFCPPYAWLINDGLPFIYNYELARPAASTQVSGPYGDAFLRAAGVMKRWRTLGYFNGNPFANKVRSKEAFEQGRSAVAFGNSQDSQATIARSKDQGFQVDIVPSLSSTGTYPADSYLINGFALAAGTKNAEKTLRAMDLIMEDSTYDLLVYFGIEGKNYVVKNGRIDLPEGLPADRNTYPPDVSGFWFTNKSIFPPLASWTDAYIALKAAIPGMLRQTPFSAFSFVPDGVKTDLSEVTRVWQQYALPLEIGMSDDVAADVVSLRARLEAAGIRRVVGELQRQMDAFSGGRQADAATAGR